MRMFTAAAAGIAYRASPINEKGNVPYISAAAAFAHYSLNVMPGYILAADAALMAGSHVLWSVSAYSPLPLKWPLWVYRRLFPSRHVRPEKPFERNSQGLIAGDWHRRYDETGTLSSSAIIVANEFRTGRNKTVFYSMGIPTISELKNYIYSVRSEQVELPAHSGFSQSEILSLYQNTVAFSDVLDAARLFEYVCNQSNLHNLSKIPGWLGLALQSKPVLFIGPHATVLYRILYEDTASARMTCQDVVNKVYGDGDYTRWRNDMAAVGVQRGALLYLLSYFAYAFSANKPPGALAIQMFDRYQETGQIDAISAGLLSFQ